MSGHQISNFGQCVVVAWVSGHQISNFGKCEVVVWVSGHHISSTRDGGLGVNHRSRTLVNARWWCGWLGTRSRTLVNARWWRGCAPDLELSSMCGIGVWTPDLDFWSMRGGCVGVQQISNFGQCEVVAWVYTRSRTLVIVWRWRGCLDTRSRTLVIERRQGGILYSQRSDSCLLSQPVRQVLHPPSLLRKL